MNPLLAQFERIYVINLASRSDRREEVQVQLRNLGLDLYQEPVHLFTAVRPESAGAFPSLGARGCFMSHLGVLQHAEQNRLRSILILEDDFDFSANFVADATVLAPQLSTADWSYFYGGYQFDGLTATHPRLHLAEPGWAIGTTHCVALRGDAIAQTARYLEAMLKRPGGDPLGGPMHVDGAYCWFRKAHPQHSTLMAVPELGYQRPSRTDIHDLNWYDRVPVVRDAVNALRKVRRR